MRSPATPSGTDKVRSSRLLMVYEPTFVIGGIFLTVKTIEITAAITIAVSAMLNTGQLWQLHPINDMAT